MNEADKNEMKSSDSRICNIIEHVNEVCSFHPKELKKQTLEDKTLSRVIFYLPNG